MTDKEKFRKEVEKLKSNLMYGACSSQIAMETMCKEEAYNEVLAILDTMQEEPVSEDVVSVAKQYIDSHVFGNEEDKFTRSVLVDMFCSGANWQKTKGESITDDLGDYINELSKQFPEVSFAKLSRIAVRVAKWQKEQMMKDMMPCILEWYDGFVLSFTEEQLNNVVTKNNINIGDKVKVIVIKED